MDSIDVMINNYYLDHEGDIVQYLGPAGTSFYAFKMIARNCDPKWVGTTYVARIEYKLGLTPAYHFIASKEIEDCLGY
jgi:hypothetical protein